MSKKLKLSGHVLATKGKQLVELGPGTEVIEIDLPDKTYGLSDNDIDRIVRAGAGVVVVSVGHDEVSVAGDPPKS